MSEGIGGRQRCSYAGFGGSGGGAGNTWGGDLATSTNSAQWVNSISGANGTAASAAVNVSSLLFAASIVGCSIGQTAPATDVATHNMTIASQPPNAAATVNVVPGNILLNLPAPVNSTTTGGYVQVVDNQSQHQHVFFGAQPGNAGAAAIWMGNLTPNAANYTIAVQSQNTAFLRASANVVLVASVTSVTLGQNSLQWDQGSTPSYWQLQAGGTGATAGLNTVVLAQQGQQQTGAAANNNGGNLLLAGGAAGSGGSGAAGSSGRVQICAGATAPNLVSGTVLFDMGSAGFRTNPGGAISVAAGGNFTLTPAQYMFGYIVLSGTLSANAVVIFPNIVGAEWIVDATAVVLNAHTLTLQVNAANWGTTISPANLYYVTVGNSGSPKFFGSTLTP